MKNDWHSKHKGGGDLLGRGGERPKRVGILSKSKKHHTETTDHKENILRQMSQPKKEGGSLRQYKGGRKKKLGTFPERKRMASELKKGSV